ncbi:MAG: UDP-N-acetylmuramoyl-L-alanyl-D-glutamate--2,6-diaminopimelate ligase [Candidatus Binatia bacterium]
MQLKDLLSAGEVEEVQGNLDQFVTGLAYDSKRVQRGNIFFAVPGARVDGHEFVCEAVERGASAVVVERKIQLPEGAAWVRVRNGRSAMGQWAALFFGYPSRHMVLIGVTGTNGKTTVTYLVESIFAAAGLSTGVIGTINYRYQDHAVAAPQTTPESIDLQALLAEMVAAGMQSVTMEVSSHALAMERVRGMEFDGALFTNLSRDHLDFHEDMEHYFSSKSRLFTDHLGSSPKKGKFAIIHGGDPRGIELMERARRPGVEVISYGQDSRWDIYPLEVDDSLNGLSGRIRIKDQELPFSSRLIGTANLENILGAVGVGAALGFSPGVIAKGITQLESVPGRLEKIENCLGFTVLVDYAHTPDALERVLNTLRPLTPGSLITLFGCGGDRDRGKRPLMGEVAARISDLVVLTSDNPRTEDPLGILNDIEEGVRKTGMNKVQISDLETPNPKLTTPTGYWVEPDRRVAIRCVLRIACAGDLVLIAGKGHENYQIRGTNRTRFDDREVTRGELGRIRGEFRV